MATSRTLASSVLHSHTLPRAPCRFRFRFHFRIPSTFCSLTFSPSNFPAKSSSRLTVFSATSTDHHHSTSQDLAVLLEVDGVLMDAHRVGNRMAFNKAFERLGLDCANWTEPVYSDLAKCVCLWLFVILECSVAYARSAGDEEKMVFLYFNRQIGWPASLPTNEQGIFAKRVLQQKVLSLHLILMNVILLIISVLFTLVYVDVLQSFYLVKKQHMMWKNEEIKCKRKPNPDFCSIILNSRKLSMEKGVFSYVKLEKALEEFVMSKSLPLRPGLEQFIDDAYNEGIPVVILTTYSKSGDSIAG
ncbi:hypothetical protein ACSQ67_012482 [Phaseolus vulgaris]